MAKLDFPDASYSPWVAPNNVIYTYIGTSPNGYWEANTANAATNLTAVFVERTGSTMTGPLISGLSGTGYGYQLNNGSTNLGGLYRDTGSSRLILGNGSSTKIDLQGSSGAATFVGNVGIGTSSPQRALVVSDAGTEGFEFYPGSSSGNNTVNHYNRSTSAYVNINTTADQHIFGRADGEKMRIDSSGNVGINCNDPQTPLEISTSSADYRIQFSHEGGQNYIKSFDSNHSTYRLLGFDSATYLFDINGTERMRIDSSGNVGIGTTSPSGRLTVGSTGDNTKLLVSSDYAATLELQNGGGSEVNVINSAGSGNLSFRVSNSEKMRLDNNGNLQVSIGQFTVGTHGTTGLQFINEGTFGTIQSAPLKFRTAAAERMRIDTSGNVGIGTSSPGSKLHIAEISGNAKLTIQRTNTASNTNDYGSILWKSSAGNNNGLIGVARQSAENNGYMFFSTANGGTLAERLRIDSSGDVELMQGKNLTWVYAGGSTHRARIRAESSDTLIFENGSSNSERMRIDSSGRLLVGTSTSPTTDVDVKMVIKSTGGPAIQFQRNDGTTISGELLGRIVATATDGSATPAAQIAFRADGTHTATSSPGCIVFSTTADGASSPTERMKILSGGAMLVPYIYATTSASAANVIVGSDGNLFRSTSSGKYKTQVENLQDSYADALLNCRPVWYRSTCKLDDTTHGYWGFIAEEVAEIDPRLIHWKKTEITYDEKGQTVETACEPEAEGVQYDRFVPHLLNLIKRQQTAIETLEQRLSDAGIA